MKDSLISLGMVVACLFVCTEGSTAQATPDLYATDAVPEFRLTFKQSNWWSQLVTNKSSRTNIAADLTVNGKLTLKNVGVRFRGNTSYSFNRRFSQKLPFNIQTDAFVPGQKLWSYSNLNLSNSYKDATFVREVVAYEFMRKHVPSLKAGWVRLYLNDVYWGVYVNIEQPNKGFLGTWFKDKDGNLYRGDAPQRNSRPTLTYLGSDPNTYARYYDYKTENHPSPWVDLIKLTDVLDRGSITTRRQDLPKVLNVDRALWYIALQTMFSNTDSYIGTGNDYLIYNDPTHDRFQIMPWDLNTTFGGYDWPGLRLGAQGLKRMDPFYSGGTRLRRPLMTNVWAIPEWRQRYLAHYRTMLDTWFDWKKLEPTIRKYHRLIEPYVKADTKKLYTTQQFYDNVTKDVVVRDSFGSYTIPGLKDFVEVKRAFLLQHSAVNQKAPTIAGLTHSPAKPTPRDVISVTASIQNAKAATLHWRARGAFLQFAMRDDGQSGDGAANDGVWGAQFRPLPSGTRIEYYIEASTSALNTSTRTFAPRRTTHDLRLIRVEYPRATSPVRLNEFVAKNTSGIVDEKKQFEDWLELGNTSASPVDVGGYYLTDDLAKPTKWKIPSPSVIPAKGTLLVWLDEDKLDGRYHANFKLSAGGEEIAFFAPDGKTLLDEVVFEQQLADVASARIFDGRRGQDWVSMHAPTPRQLNDSGACGVRSYDAFATAKNPARLLVVGAPKIASSPRLDLSNGTANGVFVLLLSGSAGVHCDRRTLGADDRRSALLDAPRRQRERSCDHAAAAPRRQPAHRASRLSPGL